MERKRMRTGRWGDEEREDDEDRQKES